MFQTNETCEALKECYLMRNIPKKKSRLWLSSFKKQLINLHGGQLDVTTNIDLKSCANHPDSGCCAFFHGNLTNPKSSEDTLLYLYVIWNMLKSADLHESSHRSFVINMYVVTLAWRCICPWSLHRSLQKRREMDIFRYIGRFPRILNRNNRKKKRKLRLNAC